MRNFGVFPDHSALGTQTAGIIFDLMDEDWVLHDRGFEQPIGVVKHLNATISSAPGIAFDPDRLAQIDKVDE